MNSVDQRLVQLGISLPMPPEPVGSYVAVAEENDFLFVSGQMPLLDGTMCYAGTLGADLDLADGYAAARLAAINLVSRIRLSLCGFDRLARIVRIDGYFRVNDDFVELPGALDGCSDLLLEVFGERGRHVRTVFGVRTLPLNAVVELAAICSLVPIDGTDPTLRRVEWKQ